MKMLFYISTNIIIYFKLNKFLLLNFNVFEYHEHINYKFLIYSKKTS